MRPKIRMRENDSITCVDDEIHTTSLRVRGTLLVKYEYIDYDSFITHFIFSIVDMKKTANHIKK